MSQIRSDAPVVLVLAAGRGERFRAAGGRTHKLDALLAGRPVLAHTLAAVQASGLPWHVVRPQDHADPQTAGMGDSIAAGVRATRDAAGWLVLPGDLPLVQPVSLQRVAQAVQAGAPVVVPVHGGQRGHPVGFGAVCGAALAALGGDQGAAAVVRAHGPLLLALDDPGIVTDVDTPALLAQAEALLRARG